MNKAFIYNIIFHSDTKLGKLFDIVLLITILISVTIVNLQSIAPIQAEYAAIFNIIEWSITILFTIEYLLRIYVSTQSVKYIKSFFGIIDLLSILPKYLSLFFVSSSVLIALRALRLLRVFSILKLNRYVDESNRLSKALKDSVAKISVFLLTVIVICIILGSIMYVIEGPEHGFNNIPTSIYWCIVTLTTVGYGDIAPGTSIGKFVAALIMIIGYGVIAVPTGIISSSYSNTSKKSNQKKCPHCHTPINVKKALFCYICGESLNHDTSKDTSA